MTNRKRGIVKKFNFDKTSWGVRPLGATVTISKITAVRQRTETPITDAPLMEHRIEWANNYPGMYQMFHMNVFLLHLIIQNSWPPSLSVQDLQLWINFKIEGI